MDAAVSVRMFRSFRKFFVGGCVFYTVTQYGLNLWVLAEDSMEPSFSDGQIVLTTPWYMNLTIGDVIIAKSPRDPNERICKRIKGLPGDTVKTGRSTIEVVPPGKMWLEGDNASVSVDSRAYGPVPIGLMVGRVVCRLWPFALRSEWTQKN